MGRKEARARSEKSEWMLAMEGCRTSHGCTCTKALCRSLIKVRTVSELSYMQHATCKILHSVMTIFASTEKVSS